MPFKCYLCEDKQVYLNYFCEDCRRIKNLMNVYGAEGVYDILEKVCVRDRKQQDHKIKTIQKDETNQK